LPNLHCSTLQKDKAKKEKLTNASGIAIVIARAKTKLFLQRYYRNNTSYLRLELGYLKEGKYRLDNHKGSCKHSFAGFTQSDSINLLKKLSVLIKLVGFYEGS